MRHPYEKFIRIELICITFVILVGVFAIFQSAALVILMCFFVLALSLCCDALIEYYSHRTVQAAKQLIRAIMIILFTTILFFQL
ncbi:hypothetical protein KFZ56_17280 [Virgibacillus sp. NKC19-3]|uniref:hypothetical protein n=1 Tax=Virgibacillus saliphilus TaxID=2831674 RepID=UPI001C9AF9BB|nr:hypothetical protein [Virgibacillus sp. NKC19-3]MBY7144775.1 hypothetical protein [Virgibacillus sp. NKC19-3]